MTVSSLHPMARQSLPEASRPACRGEQACDWQGRLNEGERRSRAPSSQWRCAVEDARELRERLAATEGPAGAWTMSLTAAELRLLPYLATHLTFREIASRLFVSRSTVKTEALSIYRKLTASSRSEAVERAVEVGLLDGSIFPPRVNFNQ